MGEYFKFDLSYDERDLAIIEGLKSLGFAEDANTEGRLAYKPEGSAKELGSVFMNAGSDNVSVTNHRKGIRNESVSKDTLLADIEQELSARQERA